MEYIINAKGEDFTIIMFNYLGRNWEILKDFKNEADIQICLSKRVSELDIEFSTNGSFDYSDLIVDYNEKNNDEQWQQEL